MEPTDRRKVECIRLMTAHIVSTDGCDIRCVGATCSQWIPTTHGSPPAENVGVCADNGKRLMIDRSAS